MRMIIDMADNTRMLSGMDTGIEQRAGGPHVSDLMELFHKGIYVDMPAPVKGSKWPKGDENIVISVKKPKSASTEVEEGKQE